MGKQKFKASIFFVDPNGDERFLFKLINYGQDTDELKFIFNHPESSDATIYNRDGKKLFEESIIRFYDELSYHSDGSLLWKFPSTQEGQSKIIENPHGTGSRRTPLSALEEWEPVVLGNILKYENCKTGLTEDAKIIPANDNIFDGNPFDFYIFLGHMKYKKPPNNKSEEIIYRVNDIADNIDMALWIRKSEYSGMPFKFGNQTAVNDNNRIKIAEPRLQINNGRIEIDLKILWNTRWNTAVINEDKILNINNLKKLPARTKIGKAYLKDNPYLNQLIDLVGFNQGFRIYPEFNGKRLKIELSGILDKDDNGAFFGFGTMP